MDQATQGPDTFDVEDPSSPLTDEPNSDDDSPLLAFQSERQPQLGGIRSWIHHRLSKSWKAIGQQYYYQSVRSALSRWPPVRYLLRVLTIGSLVPLIILVVFLYRKRFSTFKAPPYNVDETVYRITQFYELLQDMHYLGRDAIKYPPHNLNFTAMEHLQLDPKVIETLTKLPYIAPHEDLRNSQTGEFLSDQELAEFHKNDTTWWLGWMGQDRPVLWANGRFVDYRNTTNLYQAQDPLLLARFGKVETNGSSFEEDMMQLNWILPRSAIPLSFLGPSGHGMVLVLDTATNRIVVLDSQVGGRSGDPYFNDWGQEPLNVPFWDEDEDIPQQFKSQGPYYWTETYDAQLADDLLRSFIRRTIRMGHDYFYPGSLEPRTSTSTKYDQPPWQDIIGILYFSTHWCNEVPEDFFNGGVRLSQRPTRSCWGVKRIFDVDQFDREMSSLRHDIPMRYLGDWYMPVPRDRGSIKKLKRFGLITEEQLAYAESDDPLIVQNLPWWVAECLKSFQIAVHDLEDLSLECRGLFDSNHRH